MNKTKLYIPKKCKVGFQSRSDTFNGKLGYIIYHDVKIWRKESSWESWRESYISPEEYEQKKQEDFKNRVNNLTTTFEKYFQKENNDFYNSYYWEQINKHENLEKYLEYNNCGDYDNYKFTIYHKSTDESINPRNGRFRRLLTSKELDFMCEKLKQENY